MMHHLLNKVEEIELLRGGGDGEEREQHQEGDHKLHPCQLAKISGEAKRKLRGVRLKNRVIKKSTSLHFRNDEPWCYF